MTVALRIRRAQKFIAQLMAIPNRTDSENAELLWWEHRLNQLQARRRNR